MHKDEKEPKETLGKKVKDKACLLYTSDAADD